MRDWSGINIHYLWAAIGMQVVFVSVTETDNSSLAAKRFEISQGGVKLSIIWLSINYSSEDVFH